MTLLTTITAVFLIPAPLWVIGLSFRQDSRPMVRCLLAALGTAIAGHGLWIAMVVRLGLPRD